MASTGLPPEIWLQIFGYATHIPGAYTCTDGQAIIAFASDEYGIIAHRRHREATDTMLAVGRVCRSLVPIAAEFLFKYLLVKSGDHAIKIAAVLRRFANSSLYPLSPGRWTIRLELALEGVHRWGTSHTIALAQIFSFIPNVRVFSTAFMATDGALLTQRRFLNAMRDVGMRFGLRRVELKGSLRDLEIVLCSLAPHLHVLWFIPSHESIIYRRASAMRFYKLRTFIFSGSATPPPSWTMPNLQSLCLGNAFYPTINGFFEVHSVQLQHLTASSNVLPSLSLCANLVEWSLPAHVLSSAEGVALPSSIRLLTIVEGPLPSTMLRLNHIALLRGWVDGKRLPVLSTIHFLLALGAYLERDGGQEDWKYATEALDSSCRTSGILLEVSLGADEHTASIRRPLSAGNLLVATHHG